MSQAKVVHEGQTSRTWELRGGVGLSDGLLEVLVVGLHESVIWAGGRAL